MSIILDDLRRHLHRYYGKYSGEVTDIDDEDKRGRVKVKVPSIYGDKTKVWARPCLPFGHFFVPAVGSKVWIEFEGGDQRYPIWVGTWYPEEKVPKVADKKPPETRLIHTPSGHQVEFTDKKDEEQIVITHKGGSAITIAKDDKITITHKNKDTVEIDKDKITIKNKDGSKVELDGGKITAKNKDGKASVELDGGTATVKADTVEVKADTVEVKGSSIKLGDGAGDAVILGDKFDQMLWTMITSHTHPSAMGPTGPSAQLMPLKMTSVLSKTVKTK